MVVVRNSTILLTISAVYSNKLEHEKLLQYLITNQIPKEYTKEETIQRRKASEEDLKNVIRRTKRQSLLKIELHKS